MMFLNPTCVLLGTLSIVGLDALPVQLNSAIQEAESLGCAPTGAFAAACSQWVANAADDVAGECTNACYFELDKLVASGCDVAVRDTFMPYHTECKANLPTQSPTHSPTHTPTFDPTETPTETPTTHSPSPSPSHSPTEHPTAEPTHTPTDQPTDFPTTEPTADPTHNPTASPTNEPTQLPTDAPTDLPTYQPTRTPTEFPTTLPPTTDDPSFAPTHTPSEEPTAKPTDTPTHSPTANPTEAPTLPACKDLLKSDVVLVVDSSASISAPQWSQFMNFVDQITGDFPISKDGMSLGGVQFATRAFKYSNLEEDKMKARDARKNMAPRGAPAGVGPTGKMGNKTNLHLGLEEAMKLPGRKDAVNTLLVLTDGLPSNGTAPGSPADLACRKAISQGFKVVFVLVGALFQWLPLPNEWMSAPAVQINDFDGLEAVRSTVVNMVCEQAVTTSSPRTATVGTTAAPNSPPLPHFATLMPSSQNPGPGMVMQYYKKYEKKNICKNMCENIACLFNKTKCELEAACNAAVGCTGFSFTSDSVTTGSGCLKKCGDVKSEELEAGTHDYWARGQYSECKATGLYNQDLNDHELPDQKLLREEKMCITCIGQYLQQISAAYAQCAEATLGSSSNSVDHTACAKYADPRAQLGFELTKAAFDAELLKPSQKDGIASLKASFRALLGDLDGMHAGCNRKPSSCTSAKEFTVKISSGQDYLARLKVLQPELSDLELRQNAGPTSDIQAHSFTKALSGKWLHCYKPHRPHRHSPHFHPIFTRATASPTITPTRSPTRSPTPSPSLSPTPSPSLSPTAAPSNLPTDFPTAAPSKPKVKNSCECAGPKVAEVSTFNPTAAPTSTPTETPTTHSPSPSPSHAPTESPTAAPTHTPTIAPTALPKIKYIGSLTNPSAHPYVYSSRNDALAACHKAAYTRLCNKEEGDGFERCAAGWYSDFKGYWMSQTYRGCGSGRGFRGWGSGNVGAYCCGPAGEVAPTAAAPKAPPNRFEGGAWVNNNNWINKWDGIISAGCPYNQAITAVKSIHDNYKEDRLWKLKCSPLEGKSETKLKGKSYWTSYNDWDGTQSQDCSTLASPGFMTGLQSEHSNRKEDRIFKLRCTKVRKGMDSVDRPHQGDIISRVGQRFANSWDEPISFECPAGQAIVGMYSVHDNRKEDRRFQFTCGKMIRRRLEEEDLQTSKILETELQTSKILETELYANASVACKAALDDLKPLVPPSDNLFHATDAAVLRLLRRAHMDPVGPPLSLVNKLFEKFTAQCESNAAAGRPADEKLLRASFCAEVVDSMTSEHPDAGLCATTKLCEKAKIIAGTGSGYKAC